VQGAGGWRDFCLPVTSGSRLPSHTSLEVQNRLCSWQQELGKSLTRTCVQPAQPCVCAWVTASGGDCLPGQAHLSMSTPATWTLPAALQEQDCTPWEACPAADSWIP
jgi:hypothetical protein